MTDRCHSLASKLEGVTGPDLARSGVVQPTAISGVNVGCRRRVSSGSRDCVLARERVRRNVVDNIGAVRVRRAGRRIGVASLVRVHQQLRQAAARDARVAIVMQLVEFHLGTQRVQRKVDGRLFGVVG